VYQALCPQLQATVAVKRLNLDTNSDLVRLRELVGATRGCAGALLLHTAMRRSSCNPCRCPARARALKPKTTTHARAHTQRKRTRKHTRTRAQGALLREASLLRRFQHKHVLLLHTSFVVGRELWMVMPYMDLGSVRAILRRAFPQVRLCVCDVVRPRVCRVVGAGCCVCVYDGSAGA
jgi:serine/threonine protein kinase